MWHKYNDQSIVSGGTALNVGLPLPDTFRLVFRQELQNTRFGTDKRFSSRLSFLTILDVVLRDVWVVLKLPLQVEWENPTKKKSRKHDFLFVEREKRTINLEKCFLLVIFSTNKHRSATSRKLKLNTLRGRSTYTHWSLFTPFWRCWPLYHYDNTKPSRISFKVPSINSSEILAKSWQEEIFTVH